MTGMATLPISFCVTQAKPLRGTLVAMVGMRASCQPMPVLRIVAPRLDRLRQLHDLVMGGAVGDEVDHAETVDQDEIRPHALAHAAHDFDGQAHAVLVGAAPAIGCRLLVWVTRNSVQEIALAPHDLHPVIAGLAGARVAAVTIVGDLFLDPVLVQLLRGNGEIGDLMAEGATQSGAVGVAAGVQDLHRDLAAFGMHGIGDDAVVGDVLLGEKARRTRKTPPSLFGAMPPVTIRATCPRARSA